MNKINYAENNKLGREAREGYEQKLLDEQIAQQQPVLNTIKHLETERKNLKHVCEKEFLHNVKLFQFDLQDMDTRELFECNVQDFERIKFWYDKIVFEISSTASDFKATIQISQCDKDKVFKNHLVLVNYNPLCSDSCKDAHAFEDQIANANFLGFKENLNLVLTDYKMNAPIISTQANALINKIKRDKIKDREQIMSHLISELSTNGLKRPSGGIGNHRNGRIIFTERMTGEDSYYTPWQLKLLDRWRFDGEPRGGDDIELECEVTFRKRLYDKDYNDVGYQTQSGKVKIDKYKLYKWIKDLFIFQQKNYSTSEYGEDYHNRAIDELKRTPYLDTSSPYEEGNYSLFQNKKDRALRDSFGEWVKEPKTEEVKA